ncbi:hypothetical protein KW785_00185 [Candidatus Parcubacteria bacterium]|nr:hypothetical protein [Candidatus Parcubacteria bacterium]
MPYLARKIGRDSAIIFAIVVVLIFALARLSKAQEPARVARDTTTTKICAQFISLGDPFLESDNTIALFVRRDGNKDTTLLAPRRVYNRHQIILLNWYNFVYADNELVDYKVLPFRRKCPETYQAQATPTP